MDDVQRGWWSSNWKWALPSGCLLVVVMLFGGCVALVVQLAGAVKESAPYVTALDRLRASPDAVAVLGEPIGTDWGFSGGFNDRGDHGDAHYSQDVSGPDGQGTLYVEAIKDEGRWRYRVLQLVPRGDHENIDLRTPAEIAEFGDTAYEHGRDGMDVFDEADDVGDADDGDAADDSSARDPFEPYAGDEADGVDDADADADADGDGDTDTDTDTGDTKSTKPAGGEKS